MFLYLFHHSAKAHPEEFLSSLILVQTHHSRLSLWTVSFPLEEKMIHLKLLFVQCLLSFRFLSVKIHLQYLTTAPHWIFMHSLNSRWIHVKMDQARTICSECVCDIPREGHWGSLQGYSCSRETKQ